jgi:hypothetical protein
MFHFAKTRADRRSHMHRPFPPRLITRAPESVVLVECMIRCRSAAPTSLLAHVALRDKAKRMPENLPLEMGYCHCDSCRRYSGAPVSAFTAWKKENVVITKGAEFLRR